MTLDNRVEDYISEAEVWAERGSMTAMESCLNLAQRDSEASTRDINSEPKVVALKEKGYKKACLENIEGARKYAGEGEASVMVACLDLSKQYGSKVGIDFSKEIAEIEKVGYKNAALANLESATQWVAKGNCSAMETCLALANGYALKVGIDVSKEIAEIEKVGYKNGVPAELKVAREWAAKGDRAVMEACLTIAVKYAKHVGMDIRKEADEIRQIVNK